MTIPLGCSRALALITLGVFFAAARGAPITLSLPIGNPGGVTSIRLSPDGNLLLSGDGNHGISAWKVANRAQLGRRPVADNVEQAQILDDGTVVAQTGAYEITLQPINSDLHVRKISAPEEISLFVYVPDTALVTTAARGIVREWNLSGDLTRSEVIPLGCPAVLSIDVSPDGTRLAVTCGVPSLNSAGRGVFTHDIRVWDLQRHQLLWKRLLPGEDKSTSIHFSSSGALLVVGTALAFAREVSAPQLLERAKKLERTEVREFQNSATPPKRSFFRVIEADAEAVFTRDVHSMWKSATGAPIYVRAKEDGVYDDIVVPLAVSEDLARVYVTNSIENSIQTFNTDAETWDNSFVGTLFPIRRIAITNDGRRLISSSGASVRVWDLRAGRESHRLAGGTFDFTLALTDDSERMVLFEMTELSDEERISTVDLTTGEHIKSYRLIAPLHSFDDIALSEDGARFVTANDWRTGNVQLFESRSGRQIGPSFSGGPKDPYALAVANSGNWIIAAGASVDDLNDGTAMLWDSRGKSVKLTPPKQSRSWMFSPNSRYLLAAGASGDIALWDLNDGPSQSAKKERELEANHFAVPALAVSAESNQALVALRNRVYLVSLPALDVLGSWSVSARVTACAFIPGTPYVVTGGEDGSIRIWEPTAQRPLREVVSLVALDDADQWDTEYSSPFRHKGDKAAQQDLPSRWVAYDPQGHFDTNNFDDVGHIHWVSVDEPTKTLPLEALVKSNYEPGLLHSALFEKAIADPVVPPLADAITPRIEISEPILSSTANAVELEMTVSAEKLGVDRGGHQLLKDSIQEVRIFRDSQLVRDLTWHDGVLSNTPASQSCSSLLDAQLMTIKCNGIRIPGTPPATGSSSARVLFSAYGFNADGVKGVTAFRDVTLPVGAPAKRTAFIVSIGVNANANCELDLSFAAKDAHAVADTLGQSLLKTKRFSNIVPVELISDYTGNCLSNVRQAHGRVTRADATKSNVLRVLSALGGVDKTALPHSIRCGTHNPLSCPRPIHQAGPDDLVLIYFAGHGYRDSMGNFLMLPFDTKPVQSATDDAGEIATEVMDSGISSAELAGYLAAIDAGHIALIIDACHSRASIDANNFRAGPMGSRGLGELAYAKGMRVLAASQSDGLAWEKPELGHGLLTYALLVLAIQDTGRTSAWHEDKLFLSDLFSLSADAVPELYKRYFHDEEVQYATFFDFGHDDNDPLIDVRRQDGQDSVKRLEDIRIGMDKASVLSGLKRCCRLDPETSKNIPRPDIDTWHVGNEEGRSLGTVDFLDNKVHEVRRSLYLKDAGAGNFLGQVLKDVTGRCTKTEFGTKPLDSARVSLQRGQQGQGDDALPTGTLTLQCDEHNLSIQVFEDGSVDIDSTERPSDTDVKRHR